MSQLLAGWVVVWGLAACGGPASSDPDPQVLRAERGTLQPRIVLTGSLEAVTATNIDAPPNQQGSSVIEWMVDDGAEVEAGDPIVVFDSTSFVEELDGQRTSVARQRRNLLQSRASGEAAILEAAQKMERDRLEFAKTELDAEVPEEVLSRFE